MNRVLRSKTAAQWRLILEQIGICGITLVSMIGCVFLGIMNSYAAMALPFCLLVLLFLFAGAIPLFSGKRTVAAVIRGFDLRRIPLVKYLWLLPLVGLMVGFMQGSFAMKNLIDLIIIGGCIVVLLCASANSRIYMPILNIILGFALFYATSIWVELLLPGVYDGYLSLLKNGSAEKIQRFLSYYTGFTTSPGYTAGYIGAGLFACILKYSKEKRYYAGLIAYLAAALMYTGMRMPAAAIVAAVFLFAALRTPPAKRKKVFTRLLIGTVVVSAVIYIFREQLVGVPLIRRIFGLTAESAAADSLDQFFADGQMGASRGNLLRHGLKLFSEHPITGIGWGNYRESVLGALTQNLAYDAHNIYVQLLSETGIIGFVSFIIPMGYTFVQTARAVWARKLKPYEDPWTVLLSFSLMYQTYFLVLGLTDNPLYYPINQIMYLLSCTIAVAYLCGRQKAYKGVKRA